MYTRNAPSGRCYLASGKLSSQGLEMEMEVIGEVARGMNLVAGYTYTNNRSKTESAWFSINASSPLLKSYGTGPLLG